MKEYRYIECNDLVNYTGWDIVKIIPGNEIDMAVISKEDKAKKYCKDLNKNMLYKANNIKFSLEEVVR